MLPLTLRRECRVYIRHPVVFHTWGAWAGDRKEGEEWSHHSILLFPLEVHPPEKVTCQADGVLSQPFSFCVSLSPPLSVIRDDISGGRCYQPKSTVLSWWFPPLSHNYKYSLYEILLKLPFSTVSSSWPRFHRTSYNVVSSYQRLSLQTYEGVEKTVETGL